MPSEKFRERRVAVKLTPADWSDLINFLTGDIHNMDEGCPIKEQMRRIMDTIRREALSNEKLCNAKERQ